MNETVVLLSSLNLTSGPSTNTFAPNGLTATFPATRLLFPSLVVISIMEEIRPPYSAPNPPLYTSALRMMSASNTENKPIEVSLEDGKEALRIALEIVDKIKG